MRKLLLVLLVLLLSSSFTYPQWQHTIFPDAYILLTNDIYGNKGAMGGWNFGNSINVRAYYSTNRGMSWISSQTPDSLRVITKLQFIDQDLVYGCGATNLTWGKAPEPAKIKELMLDRYKRYEAKKGIFRGLEETYRGQFLQSTNGGISWTRKGILPDSVVYLTDIHFLSQTTGYVLAINQNSSGVLKTTDGGLTWNFTNIPPGVVLSSISFIDEQTGFAVGNNGILGQWGVCLKTTDGGVNWSLETIFVEDIVEIKCISADKIVFVTNSQLFGAKMFLSNDTGNTWENILTLPERTVSDGVDGLPGSWIIIYGTEFPQPNPPFIPYLYGTSNNGQNWISSALPPLIEFMADSKLINESEWLISGFTLSLNGLLLQTNNSGGLPAELISFTVRQSGDNLVLDWITASEINNRGFEVERKTENREFYSIGFIEGRGTTTSQQYYSFTDKVDGMTGKITYRLKQMDFNGTFSYSNDVEVDHNLQYKFSLDQNYPNPFNPSTRINYSLNSDAFVRLVVYDLLGNEVITLVSENKLAGNYEITFTSSGLATGIYYYRLTADEQSAIKKLQILK